MMMHGVHDDECAQDMSLKQLSCALDALFACGWRPDEHLLAAAAARLLRTAVAGREHSGGSQRAVVSQVTPPDTSRTWSRAAPSYGILELPWALKPANPNQWHAADAMPDSVMYRLRIREVRARCCD
jgi:hypothetical protein